MASGEIRAKLTLVANEFTAELERIRREIDRLNSDTSGKLGAIGKQFQTVGTNISKMGKAVVGACAPIATAFGGAMKAGIDFENSFADVKKTVDSTKLSDQSFKTLEKACIDMSKRMPMAAADIAQVMAVAGQLGVNGEADLQKVTDAAIRMGTSTNMSAEEAATAMVQFLNVSGSGTGTIDRLGSTIVALGNNTATTETPAAQESTGTTSGKVSPKESVRVRASASEDGEYLGTIYLGETYNLYENANGWCKIDYNGKVGYVKADYVDVK